MHKKLSLLMVWCFCIGSILWALYSFIGLCKVNRQLTNIRNEKYCYIVDIYDRDVENVTLRINKYMDENGYERTYDDAATEYTNNMLLYCVPKYKLDTVGEYLRSGEYSLGGKIDVKRIKDKYEPQICVNKNGEACYFIFFEFH